MYAQLMVQSMEVLNHSRFHYCSRVFHYGVCVLHVKTRRSILMGNDPASLLSSSPPYLQSSLLPLCRVDSVFLQGTSPLVRPSAVKEAVFQREPCVVLCQFTPRMSVKHSLVGNTNSFRRPHWGQTRQKIHSSLR